MDKELLKKIELAMDKAMADFKADEESIFSDERDRLKYKYESVNKLKKWKHNQNCIVQGCRKKSIARSHTIQKSGSIKRISEDGHVFTPNLNHENGKMEIIGIGVNEASTFPGFCNDHEKLFEEFEMVKDIQTGEHFGLQLYRTACREIVITKNAIESTEFLIEQYKKYRNTKIGESIKKNLGEDVLALPTFNIRSFKFTNRDGRIAMASRFLKEKQRYLDDFLLPFHNAILNDINKRKFQKTAYRVFHFDREIPMTLAGRGNFNVRSGSKLKSIEVILNVLPLHDKTLIFISTLKKFAKELDVYTHGLVHPLQIINMIERWMIHGSDHWFIKPTVWTKIDQLNQIQILEKILDDRFNIGDEFEYSIFNDLRLEIINRMEENRDMLNDKLLVFLNKEKAKLKT